MTQKYAGLDGLRKWLAEQLSATVTDRSGHSVSGITGHGSITGGDSGTDGTFALGFTGGTGTSATGTFTVAAGALTTVTILTPGAYTVVPTAFDFTASSGLQNSPMIDSTASTPVTMCHSGISGNDASNPGCVSTCV